MEPDDLDQVFTSAAAAMLFASAHYAHFLEFMTEQLGHRPEVNEGQMRRHAQRITKMIDLERIPE